MDLGLSFLPLRNDLIVRSVRIKGTIEALEPLHIGHGEGEFTNYIEVLKGPDGKPYIPGTSLKGVLRSIVEIEYSRLGAPVCPGVEIDLYSFRQDQQLINEVRQRFGKYVDLRVWKVRTCGEMNRQAIEGLNSADQDRVLSSLRELNAGLCEACKLFGTTGFFGSSVVYDALPVSYRIGEKPSLYVQGKKFFKVEYVEDGSRFSFALSLRNPANYMIGAIILALKDLKDGRFKVGGFKSRGFGLITLKDISMEIRNYSELSFYRKDSTIILKPLDPKDVEVRLDGEIISDPGFFEKAEPFLTALNKAFRGGASGG